MVSHGAGAFDAYAALVSAGELRVWARPQCAAFVALPGAEALVAGTATTPAGDGLRATGVRVGRKDRLTEWVIQQVTDNERRRRRIACAVLATYDRRTFQKE